ncbi:DNA-binding protein [Salmonella enterica subsp. enterica serovar 4,12:d:-]|uniref:DNA-binding protein n=2 Tax=Salmonella enterica TaxID=28901 RepID=A0A6Y1TPW2_SALET|nr:DNA-binding protein [Salmonella enterica subsp. enterica serovar 4,12:d:-]EAO9779272.1 DNA-binding protein [Salmonella enterica]EAV3179302.1 DNA-binding protein [Salmonella enterica subsp. enterica]EBC9131441.1 DNA-binding protein [Salmonella enterica subsp. enterica serovar Heidelberg]ECM8229699.1 DNA-binding protein [Salmonella enterica subsp. enterica serovar Kentucky]ECV8966486.1 DNA-binding protein [Salmonella enterica subsp. enterica serovar Schwarzengrund]EDR3559097.1 DNA-binding pr
MEPKSQDWHRADIKSALEKRGITLRDLSRQAGVRNLPERQFRRAVSRWGIHIMRKIMAQIHRYWYL